MDDSEADKDSGDLTNDESFEKKMIRALTIRNMILSLCIKILLKSCVFSVVQNHDTDIVSTL